MLLSHERTPSPENRKNPMWDTSNNPAAALVAKCSSCIEEYQIGSSKPWKFTIFAPASKWDSYNAVLTGPSTDTHRRGAEGCNKLREKQAMEIDLQPEGQ